ncbi:1-phosphatidylinositol-3-phosphate 5-kinase FAB1B-like isoform X2 [Asparagus officinalis]|uniref:1-phosphatidylinositol-3-phosphate 5-kinase FAB1B-like isoform X2 n=1 Tax=Asparagus officinalis TaxID=4686 RepID=UPI00098DE823|nr:1-phosphatidylinositol-3-phosphate 5-kinase FAB1B-like isoform X2 [Asparagus officinalis]
MEPPDKRFSEFVGVVKSWIPRRSEPSNVSRDFWMPDQSCRVCYECDSQFTVFNRRHHCRLCGRVFCAKCTSNSVPVSSNHATTSLGEIGERIRVCNYCFKQWEQELAADDSGNQMSSPVLCSSPSTASLASTKSTCTINSSTMTAGSMSHSTGAGPYAIYDSGPVGSQPIEMESGTDKQDRLPKVDSVVDLGDPSPNQYGFCMNSDDDDDEFGASHFGLETQRFQASNDYYGPIGFDDFDQGYQSDKVYPSEENADDKKIHCSVPNNAEFPTSFDEDKIRARAGHDNSYEGGPSSTIYGMEGLDIEPVDFENSKQLWHPPEPEDEEDEREPTLFDDEDDEDATGEWGYLRSSNSFGSGEYRARDRSGEEHKKAMKNVVDGHFRALIAQLLQVENLSAGDENNKESWLEIITSLSWEAATLLKPDTSKGGGMDPGGYVKVKCLASGRRCESMVVKGVVCKKNIAHRRMSSKIEKPRFLILGGALEYQRVTNMLSSVDTLLQQEMDHLKMAVAKIDAHHPNVLLVEKSVSRFAQDYLLAKNISLVLNIKRPLLERIARCTGAQIVPSIDHLSSQKLGYCDLFHVEKYFEEHGSAGQGVKKLMKTLMFFEGCPKPLGYTILLKGASGDELKKVKHVVQYGVFAAYHLALETSFLADEGASLPELPLKSPIAVALPDKPSQISRSISTFSGFSTPASSNPQITSNVLGPDESDSTPLEQDRQADPEHQNLATVISSPEHSSTGAEGDEKNTGAVEHVEPESVRYNVQTFEQNSGSEGGDKWMVNDTLPENKQIAGEQPCSSDAEIRHQENSQKDDHELSKEEFSSSDHQSILVSLSSRCIWKGTVCERAHLFRIKYYGNFDKPLGRFLRDNLFDESYRCRSCECPPEAHVHCYTHHQGSLTISVRKQDFTLPGERDGKIWMWHRCLRCPRINGFPPATRRVVMSDAAWGLSFGKFLELSFSNNAAASRVASCGHSLHRDCLRFYGFGKTVACFRYAPVNVHSVYLPPSKLDFNYQHQEWIQKEADEVAKDAELLFKEVLNKLRQIAASGFNTGSCDENVKVLESRSVFAELEGILQNEKAEFEDSLQKVANKEAKKGQPRIDILEINKLRRQLLFQSYFWDQRLVCAANVGHHREVIGGISTRSKEKLGSMDKLSDSTLISPKPLKGFHSLDALPSYSTNKDPLKMPLSDNQESEHHDQTLMAQEKRDVENDPLYRKHSKASSISAIDQLDSVESGLPPVRRIHSDVQFPAMEDLSDTLDAKWRGENGPNVVESSTSNSLSATEATSLSIDCEEKRGTDVSRSLSSIQHTSIEDGAVSFPSLIGTPFSNFYRSINKEENASKLDALNEYSPVYISLFRELERQGGARLLLPIGINDIVIPVYDDEPTSAICYALVSPDYNSQMSEEREKVKDISDSSFTLTIYDSGNFHPFQSVDDMSLISDPLTYTKALHARVSFSGDGPLGKVKYTVTCYYAKRFDALRRSCCSSEVDFIRSLSRCKKWGAQGGKSNVFFAKSLDDRFIIKQVTKTELESFIKFAPEYFKYLSESIRTGSPTCLAKILGIYQITKSMKGGKESRIDVLVMENLLFGRTVTRLYDLKGSARSRYNADSSGKNKVLLDQNLIESMPTSPIFVGNKAKRLLERAVWNDTAFLASVDVMDYSLLAGVDEEKHELVLGIIDFMRQYTWDKHLETWVKASGILGGPKNEPPTVISPKQYKKRFRKAMSAYFLVVPDQWSSSTIIPSPSQSEIVDDAQNP